MSDNSSPTISKWLAAAQAQLKAAGVATAKLDATVLLEDVLSKDRAHLLAHPELELTNEQKTKLDELVSRRTKHEPLAFIRGKTEFYGREFIINESVLEPRPETETMIDQLKKLPIQKSVIADIGTGSGAIAITAKLEAPDATVVAVDIDPKCLEVTAKNIKKHAVELEVHQGNLFEPVKKADILLCNLPYVPDSFTINTAALHEPHIAIFGGIDGLDLYRQLFAQIDARTWKPQYILTESLPFQHHGLAELARKHGYVQTAVEDFVQVFVR